MDLLDDLESQVDSAGRTTIVTTANTLRDACGESRLKALARERVQERLNQRGLVALPDIPGDQSEEVYVTRIGSDVHNLWRAIASPSATGLKVLVGATGGAAPVVQEQRKLSEVAALLSEASDLMGSVLADGPT